MSEGLTPELLGSLEQVGQLALGSGATTLSILLNKQVTIGSPKISVISPADLSSVIKDPLVHVDVTTAAGGSTMSLGFFLTQHDTAIITDLMMGGEGTPPSSIIDDLQLSAISEAVNQMLGMAANTLGSTYGKKLEVQPPHAGVIDNPEDAVLPAVYQEPQIVILAYQMVIEGLVTSTLIQVMPESSAINMAQVYQAAPQEKTVASAAAAPAAPPPAPQAAPPPAPQPAPQPAYAAAPQPVYAAPQPSPFSQPVNAQPAQFSPLMGPGIPQTPPSGLDLVLDVPLKVTVELGRTRMQIRDVLELGKGSVVELDKLAGEPVDLLVNGKLIARGEVVVIDENFGIRVTDIVSPAERFSSFRS